MRTVRHGAEYWKIHDDGAIERPKLVKPNAATWRVVGAVRYNNFGNEVERFSLADVLNKDIQWHHKNGEQRVHIIDYDHGTYRVWMSPDHTVLWRRND